MNANLPGRFATLTRSASLEHHPPQIQFAAFKATLTAALATILATIMAAALICSAN